ncbi:MAG: PocR ligand-binding domain-containing protein [Clostridia bacterium]
MTEHAATQTKLNMEDVLAAAKDYALSTGVECLVLTENGTKIVNPCEGKLHDQLCYCLNKEIGKRCINTHFEGAIRATDTESSKTYYCPMGLLHWASPIIIGGRVEAALIAGHTFLNHSSSDLAYLKNVTANHEELLKSYPDLKKSLMESPVISEERLSSLKSLLDRVASTFSDSRGNSAACKDMREAFRRHMENDTVNKAEIPWQALLEDYGQKEPAVINKEMDQMISVLKGQTSLKQGKAALTQLVLSVYDRSLEQEGQCFLSDRCLNVLNDLEQIKTKDELITWTQDTIPGLLEAGTIVPGIKNADMIYSALQYIEDHYSEKFSLQDIADYVHFSAPYFSKVFKKEMDVTFTKYLTNVRIEKSKLLLKNSKYALSDIPAMVGFEEQSYFTRVFRTVTGVSPGKYRETNATVH